MTRQQENHIKFLEGELVHRNQEVAILVGKVKNLEKQLIDLDRDNGKLQDNIRGYDMLKNQYDDIKKKYDKISVSEFTVKEANDKVDITSKRNANLELEIVDLKNRYRKLKDAFVYNHFRLEDELVHIVTMEKNHFNNIAKKFNINVYRMERFTNGQDDQVVAQK